MAQYPTSFGLGTLAPATGYTFRSDVAGSFFGLSIATLGDINGDGTPDIIIGEPGRNLPDPMSPPLPNPTLAGRSHIVFGNSANLAALDAADGATDSVISVSSITAGRGYTLSYSVSADASGTSFAGAGDVDGVAGADILIGSPGNVAGSTGGKALLVSGGANLAVLDGADGAVDGQIALGLAGSNGGYTFLGRAADDRAGISVDGAPDLNGDGIGDLLIGAKEADYTGATNAGEVALVFGGASNLAALDGADGAVDHSVSLTQLAASGRGYLLQGATGADQAGFDVDGVADVNGDGIADIIVGAYTDNAGGTVGGAAYLLFGGAANLEALDTAGGATNDNRINIGAVNGTTGYVFDPGTTTGRFAWAVSAAGDVNGDGINDLLIGDPFADPGSTNAGDVFLVFGGAGNLATLDAADGTNGVINPLNVNGTTGYRFSGLNGEWLGQSVASTRDMNGDGFADIVLGANFRNIPGQGGNDAGATYVFFGGPNLALSDAADGADGRITTSAVDGARAFRVDGAAGEDQVGWAVAGIGDLNGDGMSEMLVGGIRNRAGVTDVGSGKAYLVFSRQPDAVVSRSGTAIAQTILGGAFGDTLSGLGGNDVLEGRDGGDMLNGGTETDTDTASYEHATGAVTANLASGGTVGEAQGDSYTSIENLRGSAFGDTLTGDGLANVIDGRGGIDTMTGGGGNDIYYVDDTGDTIVEAAAGGTDTVIATASVSLGAEIERVSLRGNATISADGNILRNLMNGNDAANFLNGNAGNDRIDGFGGNDTLTGGLGSDLLTGGDGADIFRFNSTTESPNGGGRDRIMDFEQGSDTIDLSAIVTSAIGGGYTLLASGAAFSGAGGELRVVTFSGQLVVQGDTNGDKRGDIEIAVTSFDGSALTLTGADFML